MKLNAIQQHKTTGKRLKCMLLAAVINEFIGAACSVLKINPSQLLL